MMNNTQKLNASSFAGSIITDQGFGDFETMIYGTKGKHDVIPFWLEPDYIWHQAKWSWKVYPKAWAIYGGGAIAAGILIYAFVKN